MKNITIDQVQESELIDLQKIGKETFLESFSDQNSTSDMAIYIKEKFNLVHLQVEFNNPLSQFFFMKDEAKIIG